MAFDVHGALDGSPVLYLHGVPSSRLETHVFGLAEAARRAGVKLVAIDRAGVGGSSPRPGRTLADTAADVAAVADALGHPTFALVGYSAGSPFALAAASALGPRMSALAIVSGIGPGDRADLMVGQGDEVARMFRWARTRPRLLRAVLRMMAVGARWPEALVKAAAKGAPAADVAVLARPRAASDFRAFISEAFRQGTGGVLRDFQLAAGPWDFALEGLTMPVHIWHGEDDRNAPIAVARWLAEQLPDSQLHAIAAGGHASVITDRGVDILTALTASAPTT